MATAGYGRVVLTGSAVGVYGHQNVAAYGATRAGAVGLARSLAKRYGRDNIRVNSLCPGTTDTPMLRVFVARPDNPATQGMDPEELVRNRGASNPLGRMGKPEEMANAALFLLSDEASFVTGASLAVDGGSTS